MYVVLVGTRMQMRGMRAELIESVVYNTYVSSSVYVTFSNDISSDRMNDQVNGSVIRVQRTGNMFIPTTPGSHLDLFPKHRIRPSRIADLLCQHYTGQHLIDHTQILYI